MSGQKRNFQPGLCRPLIVLGILKVLRSPRAPRDQTLLSRQILLGAIELDLRLDNRRNCRELKVRRGHLTQAELGQIHQ